MTYQILLSENEPESSVVIKELIAEIDTNIEISEAETGNAALEQATSNDFDLVIIDLGTSGINGIEPLKVIHMSEPDLPILVTGIEEDDVRDEAHKAGANIIISKPLDRAEFTSSLKQLLGI